MKVRGAGIPSAGGEPGDLLVTFDVAVPKRLDDDERTAVEALARSRPPRTRAGVTAVRGRAIETE